jgi:protein-S-isoprenylcysteine O-methyltransferase Ste14
MGWSLVDELLDALEIHGAKSRHIARIGIPILFAGSMLAIAFAQAIFEFKLLPGPWWPVLGVAWVWLLWTGWHSVLFGKSRRVFIETKTHPYSAAFIASIFPGITIGFSQMLRPLLNGEVIANYKSVFLAGPDGAFEWFTFLFGNTLCVGSCMLFVWAWQTIGLANAGFVPEFVRAQFVPVQTGPYAHIRHPLFWSGIYFSLGLAFLGNTPVGYAIAVVNAVYGLIYNVLEDRRLIGIFGEQYATYARAVHPYIPASIFCHIRWLGRVKSPELRRLWQHRLRSEPPPAARRLGLARTRFPTWR